MIMQVDNYLQFENKSLTNIDNEFCFKSHAKKINTINQKKQLSNMNIYT